MINNNDTLQTNFTILDTSKSAISATKRNSFNRRILWALKKHYAIFVPNQLNFTTNPDESTKPRQRKYDRLSFLLTVDSTRRPEK